MEANKPKVTIQKPSEAIVAAANQLETIVAGEMVIGLKKPGILAQYRIVEVVGDSAKNQVYMNMIMPVLWVAEINGEPQPQPSTKRELEALIQRLGEDGIGALMRRFTPTEEGESENAAVSGDTIKN